MIETTSRVRPPDSPTRHDRSCKDQCSHENMPVGDAVTLGSFTHRPSRDVRTILLFTMSTATRKSRRQDQ